jgi:hypothetical protein
MTLSMHLEDLSYWITFEHEWWVARQVTSMGHLPGPYKRPINPRVTTQQSNLALLYWIGILSFQVILFIFWQQSHYFGPRAIFKFSLAVHLANLGLGFDRECKCQDGLRFSQIRWTNNGCIWTKVRVGQCGSRATQGDSHPLSPSFSPYQLSTHPYSL